MADDHAYIRNLRKITRAEPQFSDLEALERELYVSANDRATVVMFGSFVENHLERLLIKFMRSDLNSEDRRKTFENDGPFGTFASKIIGAYALNLIGPITRKDLELIKFLRNEFAHSRMPFDFTTPEVHAVCAQFQIPDLPQSTIPHGYLRRVPDDELEAATSLTNPKTRFISACHNLSYRMLVKRDGFKAGDFTFPDDNPVP